MDEKKQEKLPIDAKLLCDAVIELNISRRSVGLYPQDHPIRRESVEKAFDFLKQLFEIRSGITIGVAKDTLVIDEYTMERKNPVYREFALSIHRKGIAAITFYAGLELEELVKMLELVTAADIPTGGGLVDLARNRGLKHIFLAPLDVSKFGFVEDAAREDSSHSQIWEDYVYGLLEGRLAESDAEGVILTLPPEDIASFINEQVREDAPEKTYDRVITSYLRRKEGSMLNRDLFTRFLSMVQNLTPNMKQQFLKRAFSYPSIDSKEAEKLFSELTQDDIEKMMGIFSEYSSLIPESLRNVVDKLTAAKKGSGFFDMLLNAKGVVDDVEIDDRIVGLFSEDKFRTFVAEGYQLELERMLRGVDVRKSPLAEMAKDECGEEKVDRVVSEVMLELLDADSTGREDCLAILTRIAEMVNDLRDSGRFEHLTDIFNTLYSHTLTGRFREESASMLEYSFYSKEVLSKFIDAFKLWGRLDREGVMRLAGVLKRHLGDPLFDALVEERDPSIRKFLLSILVVFRSDIGPEAVRRLNDGRWYVVRNMIYLIRECGGAKFVNHVKPFARHSDSRVGIEALKTLLHFNAPGAASLVRHYLESKDLDLRDQVVRLAGIYKLKEAVPNLLEILEKKDLFGVEFYHKIPIIKTLGEIGDPRALDTFARILGSKNFLFKNTMEEIKIEIFRSLQNYPYDLARPILERGLGSKNAEIRAISEELLKRDDIRNG